MYILLCFDIMPSAFYESHYIKCLTKYFKNVSDCNPSKYTYLLPQYSSKNFLLKFKALKKMLFFFFIVVDGGILVSFGNKEIHFLNYLFLPNPLILYFF